MSVFIDSQSRLQHPQAQDLVVTCPHCQTVAHITPSAVPDFEQLQVHRPKQVGIVYQCDACHAPVFLRYTARAYSPQRIELSPQFSEVERAREKFTFTYLPEEVELFFKEALTCFSAGAFNAFASMCRRTAQAVFADVGESGRLKLFDELNEVRDLASLAPEVFGKIRSLLFGGTETNSSALPVLDDYEAGIVIEVVKDLLYEAYVRKGKLQQAMTVRRFFLDETHSNLTPVT